MSALLTSAGRLHSALACTSGHQQLTSFRRCFQTCMFSLMHSMQQTVAGHGFALAARDAEVNLSGAALQRNAPGQRPACRGMPGRWTRLFLPTVRRTACVIDNCVFAIRIVVSLGRYFMVTFLIRLMPMSCCSSLPCSYSLHIWAPVAVAFRLVDICWFWRQISFRISKAWKVRLPHLE